MNREREINGMIRVLESISKTAREASLTGAFSEGKGAAIRQYNAVLKRLEEMGEIPQGLFPHLDEDASFDDVGVASGQLESYLRGVLEPERKETEERKATPIFGDDDVVIVGGDVFKELGEWLRSDFFSGFKDMFKDFLKSKGEEEEEVEEEELSLDELESRMAELGGQMQVLAEKLRREELSPDEIKRLADEMHRIGLKQAELARKRAMLRMKMEEEKEEV